MLRGCKLDNHRQTAVIVDGSSGKSRRHSQNPNKRTHHCVLKPMSVDGCKSTNDKWEGSLSSRYTRPRCIRTRSTPCPILSFHYSSVVCALSSCFSSAIPIVGPKRGQVNARRPGLCLYVPLENLLIRSCDAQWGTMSCHRSQWKLIHRFLSLRVTRLRRDISKFRASQNASLR